MWLLQCNVLLVVERNNLLALRVVFKTSLDKIAFSRWVCDIVLKLKGIFSVTKQIRDGDSLSAALPCLPSCPYTMWLLCQSCLPGWGILSFVLSEKSPNNHAAFCSWSLLLQLQLHMISSEANLKSVVEKVEILYFLKKILLRLY